MESLSVRAARRLALARSGLLEPGLTGFPARVAAGGDGRAECHEALRRLAYLQLDSIAVAGARSHAIVLASRIAGLRTGVAEELLRHGAPLFEYWGHEASWLPIELYPAFGFRRRDYREHPWWGDLIGAHPREARAIVRRIRVEGPLRSSDLGEGSKGGFWNLTINKKLLSALWSRGDLAVRERRGFLRTYDLAERVIPRRWREARVRKPAGLEQLMLRALAAAGWATTGHLAATWRLRNMRADVERALARLERRGAIRRCAAGAGAGASGWIRPEDLELAARLEARRPRGDRSVLLSPFDPLLWDKARVRRLFDFDHRMEIFKPPAQRDYGYYCLPLLAGEQLIGRCDLKADRRARRLDVLASYFEPRRARRSAASDRRVALRALARHARSVELALTS